MFSSERPMLGFSPKLPITDEDRQWVDEGFERLDTMLGRRRILEATVVLPSAEHFPDPYDATPVAAERLFCRVCAFMKVDRSQIEFEIFPDETEELREILPSWHSTQGKSAAGLYVHPTKEGSSKEGGNVGSRMVVALKSTLLKDPLSLVAASAHELGHVILLGGGLIERDTPDHEPMTDLLTVYLGFGIFTANSAARFKQFQEERRIGWSMQKLGYLPEEVYGYALAKFAAVRGEDKGEWTKHLSTNVRAYFKSSAAWLNKNAR
jgi:hypothetical protein